MSVLPEPRYPNVTELVSCAQALASHRPGLCSFRQVGVSRAGRPLHLLSMGHAERAVLVVAGAHANEPTGGSTLLALAERVLHERQLRADTSWHFLLCADPDGASLHETPAPRTLLDYHLGFFRPAGAEQPEWSPSVLSPDRLPPETRALTKVIDELRPYLQATLHGTDLGGSWVQLTKDVPGLAEPFAKSAAELHIPVERGASDAAGWPASGPGVHVMPEPGTNAPYPSIPDDVRHSTWYHAHRYGGLTAVVEVPMWASDLVDDPAPHPAPDAAMRHLAHAAAAGLAPGGGRPHRRAAPPAGPRRPPAAGREVGPGAGAGAGRRLGRSPSGGHDDGVRRQRGRLRPPPPPPGRRDAPPRPPADGRPRGPHLQHLVASWSEAFAERFRARWVPLEHQVEHQSRTVVAAAHHARERAE